MKKALIVLLVFLLVSAVGIVLAKNIIARTVLIKGIKAAAGLDISVGGVQVGLLDTTVRVENLKIFNPASFSEKTMADIPEVFVSYDLGAFMKNKVHLKEVRVHVQELNLVHDQGMKLNVNSLGLLLPPAGGGEPPEVKIDSLGLIIGKVAYKNYMLGGAPKGFEFEAGINETFKNVTDPAKIAKEVIARLISRAGVADLAGGAFDSVKKQANDLKLQVKTLIGEAAGEAQKEAKDLNFQVKTIIGSGAEEAQQPAQ
ncbi:MAG: hypothetical protein WC478_04460 [Candidatus Omnitrophota bacterium]